jgi:hypothetical protein
VVKGGRWLRCVRDGSVGLFVGRCLKIGWGTGGGGTRCVAVWREVARYAAALLGGKFGSVREGDG